MPGRFDRITPAPVMPIPEPGLSIMIEKDVTATTR